MNRCPITYEECGVSTYSQRGLRLLNKNLTNLNSFPLTASEQRREALVRAGKISIQGVKPKLSARLSVKKSVFEIVNKGGHYILKPQHTTYPELPENEGLTMHLADIAGLNVPLNGLVLSRDDTLTYFIRRFDRAGKARKLATEDFAQLSGKDRETKYNFSMEKIIALIEQHCTFPAVERAKLFRRSLFSFLIGNEDMHLKNFSLIRRDGMIELSPLYDYLNTTIALQSIGKPLEEIEELALPLNGKKRKLTRKDCIDYFGRDRLQLTAKVIDDCLQTFETSIPKWHNLIAISFLTDPVKLLYSELLQRRCVLLGL